MKYLFWPAKCSFYSPWRICSQQTSIICVSVIGQDHLPKYGVDGVQMSAITRTIAILLKHKYVCEHDIPHNSLSLFSVKLIPPNVIQACTPCAWQQRMEHNQPIQPNVL